MTVKYGNIVLKQFNIKIKPSGANDFYAQADAIAAKAGLTKADAKKALEATIEAISEALKAGDKVALIGFGTFAVAERPARQGVNPQTGKAIQIAAKKLAKFKAGAELEAALQ